MYLKSLEMNGFKSFADRTRMEFHPGVTGIVGPNGCGKSNVVDALRWVLGETSAKALRGGEMADVIFNGTDGRKPLGMAEVILTLSDCEDILPVDYHEVSIGRRLYRDGKSEYLINRKPCRLRDINDLFVDTGIGRTCYSIMEQGKIDMLLSSKPEDRRQVFEEAAGITKFKQQKKEALRKLDYTEANLMRITDVMEEQQRQIASLQRQAAKARRYANLLQHVRVLDTHLSHRHYQSYLGELNQAREDLTAMRQNQQQAAISIERAQEALTLSRQRFQELEQELATSVQALSEKTAHIQSSRRHIEFNAERQTEWTTLIERNEGEIKALQERQTQEKDQLTAADEELHRRSTSLETQEENLSAATAALTRHRDERQALEALFLQKHQDVSARESQDGALRTQVEHLRSQLESSAQRKQQLDDNLRQWNRTQSDKRKETETLKAQRKAADEQLGTLTERLSKQESTHARLAETLQSAQEEGNNLTRQLASQQARLEMLRQLAHSGEGLEQGTRAVLQGLEQLETFASTVEGTLISFLQVDDDHVAALEAALGSTIQTVLIKDGSAAGPMLASLRERKLGNASLALSDAGPEVGRPELPASARGWLLDHIEVSSPAAPLLQRLLNHVALVEDLDSALRLQKSHPDVAFVTLEGDFLSKDGVISGGFRDPETGSALRVQKEITKLERQTSKLSRTLEEQEEKTAQWEQQLREAESAVKELREAMQKLRLERSTLEAQWSLALRELEQAEAQLKIQEKERLDFSRNRETTEQRCAELEKARNTLLTETQELKQALPPLQEKLRQAQSQEEEAADKTAQLRTQLAVDRQSTESLKQQLDPLNRRLRELDTSLQQRQSEIENHRQRIEAAKRESARLEEEIVSTRNDVQSLQAGHESLVEKRSALSAEIESSEASLNALRQKEATLAQQGGQIEVKMTQVELRLENISAQIQQRYQVDLEHFQSDPDSFAESVAEQRKALARGRGSATTPVEETPSEAGDGETDPDWAFVEENLPQLRRKLDSFGAVNLDAIEEFQELEERFELMQKQHEDLTGSRDELMKVIAKINKTTRALFAETFEQVAANFRSMFAELFGRGSQANLALTDEEDPLECGIEIIAKPPGKKLQSISLLSGGERSMTAVALLFAIYMVKPSPFCVLDELDAPLDEANIERFCRVLDRFIDQSQFIIVTHSKRTMNRADVMYGVSMEERGVSKTLSMQLTRAESAAAATT